MPGATFNPEGAGFAQSMPGWRFAGVFCVQYLWNPVEIRPFRSISQAGLHGALCKIDVYAEAF